jgi:long-subunit acyl-CoA synthetase (AMP-forming)
VPIYDTFGEEECQYILKQAEIRVVFVSMENLGKMTAWAKTIPSVKHIVVWGTEELPEGTGGMVITFQDCVKASADADPIISSPPKPEDLAIIMYTSGTT